MSGLLNARGCMPAPEGAEPPELTIRRGRGDSDAELYTNLLGYWRDECARLRRLEAENATWQERDDLMNRCERAANDGRDAYAAGTPIADCPYNEPGPDGITYADLIETWMLAHRNAEYEAERDAENAALRKQVGELCPVGDQDAVTSLRAEIQMLQEQVARYKPLYDAVHGMRRGMVLLHRSESDRWAAYQIGYPPVNGDTPEAALGLEEGGEDASQ